MHLVCVLSVFCLLVSCTVGQDNIPPSAKRTSSIETVHKSVPPPLVKHVSEPAQTLVQNAQSYVDDEGDTHVDTSPPPPRGMLGSTDHLKDDQFFLNIPFAEVQFNAVIDVTWVRPAAQMSKLDYIGLYEEGDPDDAIPCNWEFALGEAATGSVKLQMTNNGNMEIRYFDVAADRPRVKLPILVYPSCPNNCTNHGICEKGQCVCFAPYKGVECCEVGGQIVITVNTTSTLVGGSIFVTLTPPAGNLDKRNWIGVFPAAQVPGAVTLLQTSSNIDLRHQLLQVPVPTAASTATVDNTTEYLNLTATPPLIWRYVNESLTIPMPYTPGQYVLKVVKNVDGHPVLVTSSVIYVHGECPNGCSGHGTCVNGTCHCEAGYDQTSDCSVGDGLVHLNVSTTSCLVGSIINVTWERNSDGGFSTLDYLALFDQSDVSFDAPFAYQFAQPEELSVTPILQDSLPPLPPPGLPTQSPAPPKPVDRGFVQFNAPSANSTFVVRYFRRDHQVFAVSQPIQVYFDCLVRNCSGHGVCVKGACKCNPQWTSSDCSIGVGPIVVSCSTEPRLIGSKFNVTWSRPEKTGSIYDFIGLYSKGVDNEKPYMYRYASNEGSFQNSGIVSMQMPPQPGLYEVRYVDAFTRATVFATASIEGHLPCPNSCSGHGTCSKDVCVCNTDWTARQDCSAKVGITQLSVTPLTLDTQSAIKIVVTYKRPEGSGGPEDFIGLFPKTELNNQHPIDFVIPSADFGSVSFAVPHYSGLYQVRYIGGPKYESRAHSLDVDVTKACLNRCSEHGICNRGTCNCVTGWGSPDCSVGQGPTKVTVGPHLGNPGDKLLITYTRPVNNGDASDLLAIYYSNATDLGTPLGFVMATGNDTDTVQTKMPSVEADLAVHYIRGSDLTSLGHSSPFKVVFPCKEDCNQHGDCKLGFCTCNDGWDGFTCNRSVPTAFSVSVPTNKVAPLATITASWQAVPKRSTASDYIGLFSVTDNQNASPIAYEYAALQPTGTVNLMAAAQAGDYVVKYIGYVKGASQALAISDTVTVFVPPKTCPDSCSGNGICNTATGRCSCSAGWNGMNCATKVPTAWGVSTNALQFEPAATIEASWSRPAQNDGNYLDNVGLYAEGSDVAIQMQYVGVGYQGALQYQAPAPETSGTYVLKFTNGATGQVTAASNPFTVHSSSAAAVKKMNKRAGKRAHHVQ